MSDLLIPRRQVLRGLGTFMALPLLEAMMPSVAAASATKAIAPTRMAFLSVPNGMSMPLWTPATEGALALSPVLQPLAKVQSKLNVVTGLSQLHAEANGDGPGDHARSAAAWLTGVQPKKTAGADIHLGISADQIAARELGHLTRFPSLELGCERGGVNGDCDSGYSCAYSCNISWRGDTTPVAKEVSPRAVFERLFGSPDDVAANESKDLRDLTRRSILDFVSEDAGSLRDRLGGRDRAKLDEYFEAIRALEKRVIMAERDSKTFSLDTKTPPTGLPHDRGEHIRLVGDMMILAFQTDSTRVATFMFANEGHNRAFPECGVNDGHHDMSHHGVDPKKLENKFKIDRFHVEQLAYILEKMDSIKEGDKTMLDNTVLVYGGGISDGNAHNHDMLPVLIAGGAGGKLKTGRHLIYPDHTPMNNMLVSILDWAGVKVEKFGDATGQLQGLF